MDAKKRFIISADDHISETCCFGYDGTLPGLLIAVILLIVYGSLYPWQFAARQLPASPIWILMHAWNGGFSRRLLIDNVINLALYMPLGITAWLTLRRVAGRWASVALTLLLGAILSASIEMTQIFEPARDCSARDWVNNVIGTALGIPSAIAFARLARPVRLQVPDRGALAILFCWLASRLFPMFPMISLELLTRKLSRLWAAPIPIPLFVLTALFEWAAVGFLMRAAGFRRARLWLVVSLILIPMQLAIYDRNPSLWEGIGAVAGTILFFYFAGIPGALTVTATCFIALIVIRGLTPFHVSASPRGFLWIPFGGFLNSWWQYATRLLLAKAFDYGAAVWLLYACTRRFLYSTLVLAAVLGTVEFAQRWLPQHTPEITDPVLALLLGASLWTLSPEPALDHRTVAPETRL